jgi:iron(III) transport system ATP-binding protein
VPSFLKLEGIEKRFGTFTALKGVDLQIDQGEFVCFLGPSGCGKTTLLRIIAGLEPQSAGRIEQAGRDISRLPPSARDYGIVFQSYALFPNLSVADNVAYGLVNRKVAKAQVQQRVEELVRLVGLPGSEGKYPAQLSGGQQQRIALARALATSPGLLLLDEPLSALDAIVRVHLRQEIRSLQRTLGVTTIMVTHDQEEALSVADRIVVMNHGVIEQVGTPEQVYREPASPFVADFVGRVNVLPATMVGTAQLRIGATVFETSGPAPQVAPGSELKVYLRPEDVLARPLAPSGTAADAFGPGAINSLEARIDKVEFLGAYCLARVSCPALGDQGLTTVLSMNFLAEHRLSAGSPLALRLLPDRIRLFPQ